MLYLSGCINGVGTTPNRTRDRSPWPHKALIWMTRGTPHPLSGRSHELTCGTSTPCLDVQSRPSSCRPKQDSWLYFASNHYSFRQKHTRQDVPGSFKVTCPTPPAEWKDKGDSKSSPQQSLSAACRIMMALSPSKYHHDQKSQKVFPPSRWRGSRHYKGPLTTQSKREVSVPKKGPKNINMLDRLTNKGFGGCVRTPCLDIFYRAKEGNIILSWGGEYIKKL